MLWCTVWCVEIAVGIIDRLLSKVRRARRGVWRGVRRGVAWRVTCGVYVAKSLTSSGHPKYATEYTTKHTTHYHPPTTIHPPPPNHPPSTALKVATKSGSILFDLYTKQAYLDNLLRGGFPEVLGDGTTPKIYHTFSRIHGDLERDYNYFQIDSTYYSSGPGNFRDVNQNRRDDNKQVWFERLLQLGYL